MEARERICNFLNENQQLTAFPAKMKMKIFALMYIASKLEKDRIYSEKELNETINQNTTFNDPATIRRELYNNHFINRKNDCSAYWLEKVQPQLSDFGMSESNN